MADHCKLKPTPKLCDFDTIIFDCDGVLWKGWTPVTGASDTLMQLQDNYSKLLLFVTNNSASSRKEYVSKFSKHGLAYKPRAEQMFASSFAAAAYLHSHHTFEKGRNRVFVIGEHGIETELRDHGLEPVMADDMFPTHLTRDELEDVPIDPTIGAVVVGGDVKLTYTKIAYACFLLHDSHDVVFVSTNQDATYPSSKRIFPGSGCCVAAVSKGSQRTPINVGKPSEFLVQLLNESHDLDPERTLFVGDRLDTDILFAHRAGFTTALVLTGVTRQDQLDHLDPPLVQPDFVLNSVVNLLD